MRQNIVIQNLLKHHLIVGSQKKLFNLIIILKLILLVYIMILNKRLSNEKK